MKIDKVFDLLGKALSGLQGAFWVATIVLTGFWIAWAEPRVDAKVETLRGDVQFIKRFLYKMSPELYRQTMDEIEQEHRRGVAP